VVSTLGRGRKRMTQAKKSVLSERKKTKYEQEKHKRIRRD
jgi:hypothetical protein